MSSTQQPTLPVNGENGENTDKTRYVIFDQDIGADDAWALMMLLKAEKPCNIKVLAITCVGGNATVDGVASNTIRILKLAKRLDIPVYKGAAASIIESGLAEVPPFHGYDGLADVYTDPVDVGIIKTENAINAIYRLVKEYPKKITLICTGPLTNIALTLKIYSDFGENVKDIFIMGGNYMAVGNTRRRCTEFNFFVDTEAAYIVLNCLKCPITMLPWEPCSLEDTKIPMQWRFDYLAHIDSDFIRFMNPIEKKTYFDRGFSNWALCDMLLIATIIKPNTVIQRITDRNVTVELHGVHTRGQVAIDHMNEYSPNVKMIEKLDAGSCKELILWTLDQIEIDF